MDAQTCLLPPPSRPPPAGGRSGVITPFPSGRDGDNGGAITLFPSGFATDKAITDTGRSDAITPSPSGEGPGRGPGEGEGDMSDINDTVARILDALF